MDEYRHHVSGFFAQREDAESALSQLIERGLPRERLQVFENDSGATAPSPQTDSNQTLKDILVDGTIGTAVGTGLGALAELALVAANVSLFVASPLIAPLAMLGWGAGIGGVIGAAAGATSHSWANAGHKQGWFSALVRDAISSGQVVLLVETRSEQETTIAREVIQASVGDLNDLNAP